MSTTRDLQLLEAWHYCPDPEQSGLDAGWHQPGQFPAGTEMSAARYTGAEGTQPATSFWFHSTFSMEEDSLSRHAALQLPPFDAIAQAWLNGELLTETFPGTIALDGRLSAGENQLVIYVNASDCAGGAAGALGPVGIAMMDSVSVRHIAVRPDLRRKRVTMEVESVGEGEVHLHLEGTEHHVRGSGSTFEIDFPEFTPWAALTPHLYSLQVNLLQEDGSMDTHTVALGMRDFTIKENRFFHNGRPLHIKATKHPLEYPAGTLADLENRYTLEIHAILESGFNTVVLATRAIPQGFLECAAEKGLLVMLALPALEAGQTLEKCWAPLLKHYINSPAVVAWCLESDTPETPEVAQQMHALRELDPTRLIWVTPDARTQHQGAYMRPYMDTVQPFSAFNLALLHPVSAQAVDYLRRIMREDQLNWVMEQGVGALSAAEESGLGSSLLEDIEKQSLNKAFPDYGSLVKATQGAQGDAARQGLDALRANGNIAGYCFGQLTDTTTAPLQGVLDKTGEAKSAQRILKLVQRPVRPLIAMARDNLVPREEVPVTIALANEARLEGRAELALQVIGPTNQVLWKKKRSVKIPRHTRELWTGSIAASGSIGAHKFHVRLLRDGEVLGEAVVGFHVTKAIEKAEVNVHVMGDDDTLRRKIKKLAQLEGPTAAIHIVPPVANRICAYPAQDLNQVLVQVKDGAVGILLSPPEDWNDLAGQLDAPQIERVASNSGLSAHVVRMHPVFQGLPSRTLMMQPYAALRPTTSFQHPSDESIACAMQHGAEGDTPWTWGEDILVRRYGSGRLVFMDMPLLEQLGENGLADQLFINMLNHFARRSMPSTEVLPVPQPAVEWMRRERKRTLARWMVLGAFSGAKQDALNEVYPPEQGVETERSYPGWYKVIQWRPWHAQIEASGTHSLDVREAVPSPLAQNGDASIYYLCGECVSREKQSVAIELELNCGAKVWLNDKLIGGCSAAEAEADRAITLDGVLRQGRNQFLIKLQAGPKEGQIHFGLRAADAGSLSIKW